MIPVHDEMDAIVAKNLSKSFGTVTAVDNVSITIPEGISTGSSALDQK